MDRLKTTYITAFFLLFSCAALSAQDSTALDAGADTVSRTAPSDSTDKGFDALRYSLQKRYIYRGEPFVKNRFTDNTFLSFQAGSEQFVPFGNSTFGWGLAMKLSYGKWIDAYNAVRVSLAAERHFRNVNRAHIWNVGFDVSHMFNLSSYFGGYKPDRFFEISTVEGFKYRYSILDGNGIHAGALHIGFNLKMNVAKGLDFFVEPLVSCYSDGGDHSGPWNWRIYDIAYGGTIGLSYRMHSDKNIKRGPAGKGDSFISLSAGPQFQHSDLVRETMGVFRSMGAQYTLSYGKWFSRVFALRATGFFSHDKWIEYIDGTRKNTLYYGARVEGMLDLFGLFRSGRKSDFSIPLLFGPEVACLTKQELSGSFTRFYLGLTGGVQFKYRVLEYLSVFVEPRFSVSPYDVVNESFDPLRNVGVNYYDSVYSLNLGVELNMGFLKK